MGADFYALLENGKCAPLITINNKEIAIPLNANVKSTAYLGTDVAVAGGLSSMGKFTANNSAMVGSLSVTNTALIASDLTVGNSITANAGLSCASLYTTGTALISTDLTVAGTETIGGSLLVTGTYIQGIAPIARNFGHGILHDITTVTSTLFTINYTTTDAGAWLNIYLFGVSGGINIRYYGNYFVSAVSGKSVVIAESTKQTGGGNITLNASFTVSNSATQVRFETTSQVVDNCYSFYELCGIRINNIVLHH